ncbi:MAG: hypothetical protein K1X53_06030 [Candidatus Sumerlaeaceae bacterium]|nr:hypothetical protein [Candidatus Sumerlaeaceae bacterium]
MRFHEPLVLTTGSLVELSRLEYLISNVRLVRADGSSVTLVDQYFHLNPLEEKSSLNLEKVPDGTWHELVFDVGVSKETNHLDPARWPANHALNPLECNLHWSWQGGYVFMAIEGSVPPDKGVRQTFLYHVGTDSNLANICVGLPADTPLAQTEIIFHVDRIWNGPSKLSPLEGGGLTHSAAGDTLAPRIVRNVQRSFEARKRAP